MPEGEVLFEFGSIGYEFFIILNGSVSVGIKLKGENYEENKKAMLESEDVPMWEKVNGNRWKSKFKGELSFWTQVGQNFNLY